MNKLREREALRDELFKPEIEGYYMLIEAIAKHRTERYGSPPTPPYFAVDTELYKKAGIA